MADEMDFTPSEDQMREDYKLFAGDGEDRAKAHAEFNRGMERIKAQVRAEALREAAEEADDWKAADGMHGGEWFPSEWAGQVAGWLEHRAARIREQGKEQGS
ncbi:MAG: hypothetical protein ACTH7X_08985 [Brevibacterium aurantiacum]